MNTTGYLLKKTTIIASGASLSGAVGLNEAALVGIGLPAAWTAADLTFQGSMDGVIFRDIYDADGTEVTVQADVSRHVLIDPADFASCLYLKVRSGNVAVPVNQGAARTIDLMVRRVT
jgi:hypothetical protein